jgi:hypothetical protein
LTEIALVALRRAMYAEQKNRTASELMRMVVALAENPWQTPFDLDDVAEECERWLVSRAPSA